MYSIKLLVKSAVNDKVVIESCGSDSYLKIDGRIRDIYKVHNIAFGHVHSLKNIRPYAGVNIYRNKKLVETILFSDYEDFEFKSI